MTPFNISMLLVLLIVVIRIIYQTRKENREHLENTIARYQRDLNYIRKPKIIRHSGGVDWKNLSFMDGELRARSLPTIELRYPTEAEIKEWENNIYTIYEGQIPKNLKP